MTYVAWVAAYGIIFFLSEKASMLIGMYHVITAFTMFLYWSIFFEYFKINGYMQIYNICAPKSRRMSRFILYFPLLLIPIINATILINRSYNLGIDLKIESLRIESVLNFVITFLITVSCVIGEEILFRGFLPVVLIRRYKITILQAAIIVSVAFAAMHILNVFSGEMPYYIIVQILNAGAVGFCMVIITIRENSIVPGIVVHLMINISSLLIDRCEELMTGNSRIILSDFEFKVFKISPILYLIYGIYLYWKEREEYETIY